MKRWVIAACAATFAIFPGASSENSAEAGGHWSVLRLHVPVVPAYEKDSWARNPIDSFVARMHDRKGLEAAPEASRRTLIRRLTYDVHGLPPTPEAIDEFLGDTRFDAYERLVDRLLDSPRYGERWARHWLDIAHYGETHGFDKDQRRDNAWPYRDYIIRSFNDDKPYARFVREQIAGDVLYPDDPDAICATGFLAAGPWDLVGQLEVREDTVEKKRVRNLDRDDIVTSVFNTFLSTTVQCARCHEHKFDPISQEEYYSLQAVFAGLDRGERAYEAPEYAAIRRQLREKRAGIEAEAKRIDEEIEGLLPEEHATVKASLEKQKKEFAKRVSRKQSSPSNGYHSVVSDTADTPQWVLVDLGETYTIDRIVLVPAYPTDYKDSPGFGFPIRFEVTTAVDESGSDEESVLDSLGDDYANPGDTPVVIELNRHRARYIRIAAAQLWERNRDYAFALAEVEAYADGKQVALKKTVTASSSIDFGRWHSNFLVDGYDSRSSLFDIEPESNPELAELKAEIADKEKQLLSLLENSVPQVLIAQRRRTEEALSDAKEWEDSLPDPPKVYAMQSVDTRAVNVLERGSVTEPGALVFAGSLSMIEGLSSLSSNSTAQDEGVARAALADWIVDADNGLAWRSIANRVWQYHFGQGIVTTPNDFGLAGAAPTHPDLLDWLAAELRDSGGSLKGLHRLILTSATYRQTSAHHEANAAIDGQNQFLWRANRRKLDAESLRDAVLAVSGTLDFRMGGPSVELFNYTHDHSPKYDYVSMDDPGVFRRSIYRFIVRSVPNPLLEALDCADPNISTPIRNETLAATQALTMLNDLFILQQSAHFANRLTGYSDSPEDRIARAYALALGRAPTRDETESLLVYTGAHGTTNLARLVFNLNEFIFVD